MGSRMVQSSLALLIIAISWCGAVAAEADDATTQPASEPELLAPPPTVLSLLRTNDPEKHLEGFSAWHKWRLSLPYKKKPAANRFIARDEWFDVLSNEVLYDIEDDARRLSAYKLLRRIGGQRIFPHFLWGMGTRNDEVHSNGIGILNKYVHQPSYIKWFFKKYGDPTVISFLPDEFDWYFVTRQINRRWKGKDAPEQKWEPLMVEDFEEDLTHPEPSRRRLAIRALTTNRRYGGIVNKDQYRKLLVDEDESVRLVTVRALMITPSPEARGLLMRMVEDGEAMIELRRSALKAVIRGCRARQWTAEWMIASIIDWPEALDDAVQDGLVRLRPTTSQSYVSYLRFLHRELERVQDERRKRVIGGALKELEP